MALRTVSSLPENDCPSYCQSGDKLTIIPDVGDQLINEYLNHKLCFYI